MCSNRLVFEPTSGHLRAIEPSPPITGLNKHHTYARNRRWLGLRFGLGGRKPQPKLQPKPEPAPNPSPNPSPNPKRNTYARDRHWFDEQAAAGRRQLLVVGDSLVRVG